MDLVIKEEGHCIRNSKIIGYCHYFGLTDIADKAIAMYNFMYDNGKHRNEDDLTMWEEMGWSRGDTSEN